MTYILILFGIYFFIVIIMISGALGRYERLFGRLLMDLQEDNAAENINDIMDSTKIQAQVYFNL